MVKRKILKSEINALPLIAWEGPIDLIETFPEMETAVKSVARSHENG